MLPEPLQRFHTLVGLILGVYISVVSPRQLWSRNDKKHEWRKMWGLLGAEPSFRWQQISETFLWGIQAACFLRVTSSSLLQAGLDWQLGQPCWDHTGRSVLVPWEQRRVRALWLVCIYGQSLLWLREASWTKILGDYSHCNSSCGNCPGSFKQVQWHCCHNFHCRVSECMTGSLACDSRGAHRMCRSNTCHGKLKGAGEMVRLPCNLACVV